MIARRKVSDAHMQAAALRFVEVASGDYMYVDCINFDLDLAGMLFRPEGCLADLEAATIYLTYLGRY